MTHVQALVWGLSFLSFFRTGFLPTTSEAFPLGGGFGTGPPPPCDSHKWTSEAQALGAQGIQPLSSIFPCQTVMAACVHREAWRKALPLD